MSEIPIPKAIRVNGDRLWSRLMQMAQIGATPHGGCNRQALTDADIAGRNSLVQWAEAAGCHARVDAVGNLFLRRPGREDTLPVVMTGSHLDTQPTGGKFDGVYGVLAGLEVIESLNDQGMTTMHPVELAVWCNEEGSRFPMAMMGSAVWSGRLPLETAYGLTDRAGISVRHELQRAGLPTGEPLSRQAVKASLEVHIEQGPVLEQKATTIGVVTGVQHMSRHEVVVEGQEAHAGPTPMDMRRDPIRVLADLLPALYAATEQRGRDVERYQSSTGAYGQPWCASFQSYSWRKYGYTGPISALAFAWLDFGRHVHPSEALQGDPVVIRHAQGHIGCFLNLESNGLIRMVSGNTNNAVGVGDYAPSISTIVRLPFQGAS
jgi:acetylornithine deacetylase/succinyl-diaminopimelate desuccinylase-like protein